MSAIYLTRLFWLFCLDSITHQRQCQDKDINLAFLYINVVSGLLSKNTICKNHQNLSSLFSYEKEKKEGVLNWIIICFIVVAMLIANISYVSVKTFMRNLISSLQTLKQILDASRKTIEMPEINLKKLMYCTVQKR